MCPFHPFFVAYIARLVPALSSFTADDAKDLSALCSHISVALENIKRDDEVK